MTYFGWKERFTTTVAEREGFEPPDGLPSTVFKTAALNRSATSPGYDAGRLPKKATLYQS